MGEPRTAGQRQADLEELVRAENWDDPFHPGFQILRGVFSSAQLAGLNTILAQVPSAAAGRRWAGRELVALMRSTGMRPVAARLAALLPDMAVLRAVAFRKDADANWFVPPHQDRSIPVAAMIPPPGFGAVTRKGDGWQAEAPEAVLSEMRNCRIFVDGATIDDGPLEVMPGTHRHGRISQDALPFILARREWRALTGAPGDVALLSPLLLHRSRRAAEPSGRRVLQVECIPSDLATRLKLETAPLG
jgi:hypothetical protein